MAPATASNSTTSCRFSDFMARRLTSLKMIRVTHGAAPSPPPLIRPR